ncbi:AAA family ATPase [Devriesea agamarum]|uniref:AAA family ATPase n=1 Tax=Devriesea agamarum TaxID=472569 RepID=UPI0018D43F8F|nr:AAA family ATPase [Devriesea agamarum]
MNKPVLVVLGGLPATGKSTIAAAMRSRRPSIVYLRIDTIEQALRDSGEMGSDGVQGAGYEVGYALTRDLLVPGAVVVVECVNPLGFTRQAWNNAASDRDATIINIELFCTDTAEHRRRVENRTVSVPRLKLPDWQAVQQREYERWDGADLRIDTATASVSHASRIILDAIAATQSAR